MMKTNYNEIKPIMRKTFLMVLLHFTIIGIAYGQFSVKILNENFDSNAFRWEIMQDEYSEMSISGGKYTLNNKSEGMAITSTIESPHLQDENYRISAKLSKVKGIDNNGFGLVWGSVDANNQFEYVISANGHFKILKWENGKKTDLIEWTYHSGIKKWDMSTNTLTVENSGGLFRFYINDIYVAMLPAQKSSGKKLGFVLNENMLVEVDEIIVENLMPSVIDQPVQANDKLVISSFRLSGNNPGNTVYTNQPEKFEIIIMNHAETPAKDLSLILLPSKSADVSIYNQLTMIDIIEPGMEKKISIDLQVIENDSIENIEFIAKLQNKQGIPLDTGSISIAVKRSPVAYNPYSQQTDNETDIYFPYSDQGDDEFESCTTGCISSGLISIITALILALIPDI